MNHVIACTADILSIRKIPALPLWIRVRQCKLVELPRKGRYHERRKDGILGTIHKVQHCLTSRIIFPIVALECLKVKRPPVYPAFNKINIDKNLKTLYNKKDMKENEFNAWEG